MPTVHLPMVEKMKLRRSTNDRVIAGICSGIADALGLPARRVRVAFVLLVLFAGLSLITYIIAWILIPNDNNNPIY